MKNHKKKIIVLGLVFVKDNKELKEKIEKLIDEKSIDALVEQESDLIEFLKHGVILAPGVVVDGKLKSAGRMPKESELSKWLDSLEKEIEESDSSPDDIKKELEDELATKADDAPSDDEDNLLI